MGDGSVSGSRNPRRRPGRRGVAVVLAAVVTVLLATACSSSSSSSASSSSSSQSTAASSGAASLAGKKIGIELCCAIPQVESVATEVSAEVHKYAPNVEITVTNAEGSIQKSQSDVETFIAQGYNAIWTTIGSTVPMPALAKQAAAKHIIWVNYSGGVITGAINLIANAYGLGYAVGVQTGHWMQQHGETNVPVGATQYTLDPTNAEKTTAFIAGLHSVLPNVKVYTAVENDGTSTAGAQDGANLLEAHPGMAVLFACDSQDAVGEEQALKEAGDTNTNKYLVASIETDSQTLALMAAHSTIQIAEDQNAQLAAVAGGRLLVELLEGMKVPPTEFTRSTLVTWSNVAADEARDANPLAYPADVAEVLEPSYTQLITNGPLPNLQVGLLPA
jgi:ribose transport system substrate-binding protein